MKVEIELTTINGEDYITPGQMAAFTNRTTMAIYNLIKFGNKIRKMKSMKLGYQIFIPYKEMTEFPFTECGRSSEERVYYYNQDGTIKENNDE